MKDLKVFSAIAPLAATLACLFGLGGCTLGSAPQKNATDAKYDVLPADLRIIYLANVNGELDPCGCRTNPAGGIARKWNLFQSTHVTSENSLILDAGDLFYNTAPTPPFLKEQWDLQAHALAKSYADMGCDALAPGEKDFASGMPLFLELAKESTCTVVSANLLDRKTRELAFKPYVIIEKKGTRFGIIGISEETLEYADELEATPAEPAIKNILSEVQRKSDVVILLSHLGFDRDEQIAKAFPKISMIFGGHSQNLLNEPAQVGSVNLFQTSFRSQHIGIVSREKHELITLDERLDFKGTPLEKNPMSHLSTQTKENIARINERISQELQKDDKPALSETSPPLTSATEKTYSTFSQCLSCHDTQVKSYLNSPHGHSYLTLVQKKQSSNKDCLKCHTLGMNEPSGWKNVRTIIWKSPALNPKDVVEPKSFMEKLAQGKIPLQGKTGLAQYHRVFANAQCENCHGAASEHITTRGSSHLGTVSAQTCTKCHTQVQAPAWYTKDGALDTDEVSKKFEAVKHWHKQN